MKEFIKSCYHKKNFGIRLCIVITAIITMGFSLSFLLLLNFGTDPCTMLNDAISRKLGISFGTWQALLNCILLFVVVFFGARNLGFGTLVNVFLTGYAIDFFTWLWNQILPMEIFEILWVRVVVLIPSLILFVLSAAFYMVVDLGTAPYDAIPYVVSMRLPNVPFRTVRMIFDFSVIAIAFAFGGTFGIVTILMAFTIGPAIGWLGNYIETHTKLLS